MKYCQMKYLYTKFSAITKFGTRYTKFGKSPLDILVSYLDSIDWCYKIGPLKLVGIIKLVLQI